MTNTNRQRRDEIISHQALYGVENTCQKFGISEETIKVYKRATRAEDSPQKKILVFDIETAPMEVYSWGLWKQNIGINQIIQDWSVLCWAGKWLDGDEIFSSVSWDKGKVRDDKKCCAELAKLLSQADIVVTHNGDKFDIKKVCTRFLKHGIKEPTPFKSVDTLKIAKGRFSITSNKLEYIGRFLDVGRKVEHSGFSLWTDVLNGVSDQQENMLKYCIGDIVLLEQVYLKLRAWDKRHPNVNTRFEDRGCPCCGSNSLERIDDVYTPVSRYSAMVCKECGKYSRTAQRMKTKREMSLTQRNIV